MVIDLIWIFLDNQCSKINDSDQLAKEKKLPNIVLTLSNCCIEEKSG